MLNLPIKILRTIQLETPQATVTFANIDTLVAQWDAVAKVTSRHLVLIVNGRSPDAVDTRVIEILFNADAGNNGYFQDMYGIAAAPGAARGGPVNEIGVGFIPGTNYANAWGGTLILIPHAFNTTNHKAGLALDGGAEHIVDARAFRWAQAAAITTVRFGLDNGNYAAGSTFHLGVIDERYLVEEVSLAAVGIITFDNIPQGEGDLAVIGYAREDTLFAVEDEVIHLINDDAVAGNYPAQELIARGAVVTSASPVNQEIAIISSANATANAFGALAVLYSQYTKGNHPHFVSLSGYHESTGATSEVRVMSGRRDNAEPINKLVFEPDTGTSFSPGSLFSLYRVPKRIIQRQELTAPAATITFANIPQNFEALLLHVYTKTDRAAGSDPVVITINADAVAANYNNQQLYGFGAAPTSVRNIADRNWILISGTGPAGEYDGGVLLFPGYAETDRHKHALGLYGNSDNTAFIQSARWLSNAAITSIAITPMNGPNFVAGTIVELEGILRKEGLPPSEGMSVD